MKDKNFYSLTQPQQRIWLTQNIYPSSTMFNIGGTTIIEGNIDIKMMVKALKKIVKKYDVFQIRLTLHEAYPLQYNADESPNVEYIDLSQKNYTKEDYLQWVETQAQTPFELYDKPLYYIAFCKIEENLYGCFGKFHHIIMDGWSCQLLLEEINKTYKALKKGEESDNYFVNRELIIQEEHEYLKSQRYEKDRIYWLKMLENIPRKTYKEKYIDGMRYSYNIAEEKTADIQRFCKKNGISVNTFFVSIYILYVNKALKRNSVIIGIPMLGRINRKQREWWGMFVNVMPFVFHIQENKGIIELMKYYDKFLINGYVHQRYPYNHLAKDIEIKDILLYETCINYYKTDMEQDFDENSISYHEFYNGQQIYAMQIIIREWTGRKTFQLDFDTLNSVYSKDDVDVLFSNMIEIIDSILEMNNTTISLLREPANYKEILVNGDFNNTLKVLNKEMTVIDLFMEQVRNIPNKIAAECRGKSITYVELYQKAQVISKFLKNNKIPDSSVIGVLTEHSLETLCAIWGILLYGGVFLLIDPETPYKRMSYILNDANVKMLLTNIYLDERCDWNGMVCQLSDIQDTVDIDIKEKTHSHEIAYIMYTSGTTGKPKGVLISHKNLFNYACWAKSEYAYEFEVFALFSSLGCDLTITSIFIPTISGGKIIIYPNNHNKYPLFSVIEDNKCTVVKLTPSHLSLIQDHKVERSNIKRFIVGGEALKTKLADKILDNFGKNVEIINEYGPTEATVGCMSYRYDKKKSNLSTVPIGNPIWNTQIYILDQYYNKVPYGIEGDLYISGSNVSIGYLNQPDLTNEFFKNIMIDGMCRRIYHTGDKAKFIDDNTLIYCGREDMQVKINGYRIELAEIEQALENFQDITASCVSLVRTEQNEERLCAYYNSDKEIHEKLLRDYLAAILPNYMIPSWFIWLKDIELTQSGKWNIKNLPKPAMDNFQCKQEHYEHDILLEICEEVLNVSSLSYDDNYYHVGGDSIKAIQISSKLHEKGFVLSIKDILNNPELKKMRSFMNSASDLSSINQDICSGMISTTPIINWFFKQKFSNPDMYYQEVHLNFKRPISISICKKIMDMLIEHHDILRLNIDENNRLFYNNNHLKFDYTIEEFNISTMPDEHKFERFLQEQSSFIRKSMNMKKSLLFRSYLVHTNKFSTWCLIAHHLLVDGVSWQIILKNIYMLLDQIFQGQQLNLPKKTVSYQDWANSINKKSLFNNDMFCMESLKKNNTLYGISLAEEFSVEFTDNLLKRANDMYGTKPVELILAGLLCTIAKMRNEFPYVLEVENHGRHFLEDLDVSETVGWFTQYFYNKIEHLSLELPELVIWCKEMYRNLFLNRKVSYETNNEKRDNESTIRFNYMGEYHTDYKIFEAKPVYIFEQPMVSTIEFDGIILNKRLIVYLRLEKNICKSIKHAKEYINSFRQNMNDLLDYCLYKGVKRLSPSDFPDAELSQNDLDKLFK